MRELAVLVVLLILSLSQGDRTFPRLKLISIQQSMRQRRILIRSLQIRFEPSSQDVCKVDLNTNSFFLLSRQGQAFGYTNHDVRRLHFVERLLQKIERGEQFVSNERMTDVQRDNHCR